MHHEELQKFDSCLANIYLHMACTSASSSTYKAAICCILWHYSQETQPNQDTGWLAVHLEVVAFSVPPTATLLLGHYTKVFSAKLVDVASFGSNINEQSAKVFLPQKFPTVWYEHCRRTQGPSCVAHSLYDRLQATCVNVLNLNLWLCCCESYSPHCCTHKRHSSRKIVLFLLASFILPHCKTQELSPLLCARLLVWLAIGTCRGPGVKGHMHETLALCMQSWLCKTDSRPLWGSNISVGGLIYICYK